MFFGGVWRRFRPGWWTILAACTAGCNERERLTFPTSDGEGPMVTILSPGQDTTVTEGPFATVTGRVADDDGIDTVYFEVVGGGAAFMPYVAGGADTVSFSLPLATQGLSGVAMTVTVFGTDVGGVRGDSGIRQVTVQ